MSDPVTIVIPGAPHGKGRPRFSGKSRTTYTPARTKAYEDMVGRLASVEMRGREYLTGPLHLDVRSHFAMPKGWSEEKRSNALLGHYRPTGRPDLDNIIKGISDGLQGIVFHDDAAIVSATCSKVYAAGEPFTVATIRSVSVHRVIDNTNTSAERNGHPVLG